MKLIQFKTISLTLIFGLPLGLGVQCNQSPLIVHIDDVTKGKTINEKYISIKGKTLGKYSYYYVNQIKNRKRTMYYCPIVDKGWTTNKPVYIIVKFFEHNECNTNFVNPDRLITGMLRNANHILSGLPEAVKKIYVNKYNLNLDQNLMVLETSYSPRRDMFLYVLVLISMSISIFMLFSYFKRKNKTK